MTSTNEPNSAPDPSSGLQRNSIRVAVVLATIAALVSVIQGCINAIHRSQDFRWSVVHLFLQHIDPWNEFITGNTRHAIMMSGNPNDFAIIYVLLFPVGFLSFATAKIVWLGCNLIFTALTIYFTTRIFRLTSLESFFVGALYLASTPLRVCFGNGQQSCLLLLFIVLSFYATTDECPIHPLWAGLSYFKYNFGPPLWFFGAMRCGWRWVVYNALPYLVALFVVGLWVHTNVVHLAIEPLTVAKMTYSDIPSWDFMGVEGIVSRALSFPPILDALVGKALPILLCFLLTWRIGRRSSPLNLTAQISLVSYTGLFLMAHSTYDYILLLLPFCFLVRHRQLGWSRIAMGVIAYFWFLLKAFDVLFLDLARTDIRAFDNLQAVFNFAMLLFGFIAVWKAAAQVPRQADPQLA